MMAELFDEEYLRESYNKADKKKALELGRAEGRAEGINQMIEAMRKNGIPEEQIQMMLKNIKS